MSEGSYERHYVPPQQWNSDGVEMSKVEEMRKAASKGSPRRGHYGESVKRHLDTFDLETSLNEVYIHSLRSESLLT